MNILGGRRNSIDTEISDEGGESLKNSEVKGEILLKLEQFFNIVRKQR